MECSKLGRSGAQPWSEFRAALASMEPAQRVIIADANLDNATLCEYDLSRCYIVRTSFVNADLSDTNFRQTIFRACYADNANIEGANFRGADMSGDGITLNTRRFSSATNFEVDQAHLPDVLSPGLRSAAAKARNARRWTNRKSYSPVVRLMMVLTSHGYSLHWLTAVGLAVFLLFSSIFCCGGQSIWDAMIASAGYFLGLDSAFKGGIMHALGLLEGLLGLLYFAVLTAILVSMFFD